MNEPKASPSLKDAEPDRWRLVRERYEAYFPDRAWEACPKEQRVMMLIERLEDDARSQRRDALAEFVRRIKSRHGAAITAQDAEAVAKEMDSE